VRGLVGDVRAVAVYLTPLAFEIAPQPSNNPNGPPLPHPAAPVQHQPKPCCTVLRLAPRRSRRVGETRASPVAFSNRPLALIAAAPPPGGCPLSECRPVHSKRCRRFGPPRRRSRPGAPGSSRPGWRIGVPKGPDASTEARMAAGGDGFLRGRNLRGRDWRAGRDQQDDSKNGRKR
jgi:hypothetical protein